MGNITKYYLEKMDKMYGTQGTYVIIRHLEDIDYEVRTNTIRSIMQLLMTLADLNPNYQTEEFRHFLDLILRSKIELFITEIYLGLAGCNILAKDNTNLFKFKLGQDGFPILDMEFGEFRSNMIQLPSEVLSEMIEKVYTANPFWTIGPYGTIALETVFNEFNRIYTEAKNKKDLSQIRKPSNYNLNRICSMCDGYIESDMKGNFCRKCSSDYYATLGQSSDEAWGTYSNDIAPFLDFDDRF